MVKILEKIGYSVVRQRGSHIRLSHPSRISVSVPNHFELGRGILHQILKDAKISTEDFLKLL
jgi:predicted RNA binding protein YcfA (HicA-like mRNA interferase family)